MMGSLQPSLLMMLLLVASPALAAADDPIRVELNAAESVQNRCRLTFVIENKSETPIESLQFDLAVFSREGIIQRRWITEMGPVLRSKTIIKTFELDGDCGQMGSILINEIAGCAPGDPVACLERLVLSSRVQNVRLFK
jgi:hypothetical protein